MVDGRTVVATVVEHGHRHGDREIAEQRQLGHRPVAAVAVHGGLREDHRQLRREEPFDEPVERHSGEVVAVQFAPEPRAAGRESVAGECRAIRDDAAERVGMHEDAIRVHGWAVP